MATTTSNKRKKAVAATVAAAALLLAGTFAWASISQQALNESAGIVNVGGRLHDDFNGENKDIYVENFTDPLDGGQPIYARIKLTEYMEVGQDAGGRDDVDGDGVYEAVPVIDGTSIDDKENWPVHIPTPSVDDCETEGTHKIHEHWTWTMGNNAGTTYMPTFNKDKDSLKAEINGTYDGTNENDKVYYDDYVVYNTAGGLTVDIQDPDFTKPDGADEATPLTEADGEVTTVEGIAYYDDDTDKEDNNGTRQEEEIHTAKETQKGTVVMMADWVAAGSQPGNFWVYDTDGWAYWANPIMPGEATGLLLDQIEMTKNPGEKCYYAINVVAQFATVGDWEYFNDGQNPDAFDGTEEAEALLQQASQNVPKVTVTNTDGQTTVDMEAEDKTVGFSAAVSVGPVAGATEGDFEWAVYNADLDEVTTSTITDNGDGTATLTVGENETNSSLIVAASSTQYPGAVGLSSIAVKQPDEVQDENLKITSGLFNGMIGVQADIILKGADGNAVNPQPALSVEVKQGDQVIDTSEYMVQQYDDGTGVMVSNVTIPKINSGIYTVEASYVGDNGIKYVNSGEIDSTIADYLGLVPTDQAQPITIGTTIPTGYEDICYAVANQQGRPNITDDSSPFIMNGYKIYQILISAGSDLGYSLDYAPTITVAKNGNPVSADQFMTSIVEGTNSDGFWNCNNFVLIPVASEEEAEEYSVYVTFVGDGQTYNGGIYTLEDGVTYGAHFE